jgi:spore coat polysaccharide biosynthesis protein SpsF
MSRAETLVVVQARTGSTRLPGKVLLPLAGRPLLARLLERVRAARTPFALVVATTTEAADEPVRELCRGLRPLDVECFSGHPTDLLDRHYQAALAARAEVVVKIPSDCPLIDPGAIDRVLGRFRREPERWDYVSNLHPPTWPDGNDVEVMPMGALAAAWREASRPHEREHTTPFLWDQPERFRIANVTLDGEERGADAGGVGELEGRDPAAAARWGGAAGRDLSMSHRFTIDYPADHDFLRAVYDALWTPARPVFGLDEILALLAARPDILAINARYAGVNWYRHHLGELRTIGSAETRSPEAS